MKKYIKLLLLSLFLSSCSNNSNNLKILVPTGAPSVAFYNYVNNNNFETNSVPNNIIAMMNNNSDYDVLVIDTISGIKAIKNGSNYKLAATITFGNFYLVSTKNDNGVLEESDKIVLFGQNQTPDLVFKYIYGEKYSDLEYVNSVKDAASCYSLAKNLITGNQVDYVLLADPILTSLSIDINSESINIINIQEEYKRKSNNSMLQASIFVKNDTDGKLIDSFLNSLKNDINKANLTPDVAKNKLNELSVEEQAAIYGIKSEIAYKSLLNKTLGLDFKLARENKENIENFAKLFGVEYINEETYY